MSPEMNPEASSEPTDRARELPVRGNRDVLEAVKRATRQKGLHPLPEIDDQTVRTLDAAADILSVFREKAAALGVGVTDTDAPGLRAALAKLVAEHGRAVVEPALVRRFPQLEGLGIEEADDDTLFDAGCGITGVEFGIAETGSLVVASGPGQWRQYSFVPPVHIAVVERRQLVPDLLDVTRHYTRQWAQTGLAANFVVITGPSRTADIAQRLVQGVHGPIRVECVLIG